MKVTYDPEVDVLRIVLIVELEILDASKRVENPRSLEYAVAN